MTGTCGPSYNQRWRGSGQRSFEKWAEQANNNMWFPVDVEETAQEYTFVADVPGLGKNDIKVLFSGCLLDLDAPTCLAMYAIYAHLVCVAELLHYCLLYVESVYGSQELTC